AEELLHRLGAVAKGGELTPLGRRMLRFPIHPRLGRLLCAGEDRGIPDAACTAAALIAERDIRQRGRPSFTGSAPGHGGASDRSGIDLLELHDLFRQAERARFAPQRLRSLALDPRAVETAERARRQLRAIATRPAGAGASADRADADAEDTALALATLAAFPDRVARRRSNVANAAGPAGGGRTVLLSGGGAADVAYESSGEWMVAIDVEETATTSRAPNPRGNNRIAVRLGVSIQPDWLLDLFPDALQEQQTLVFNPTTEQVERSYRLTYSALTLDESVTPAPPSQETAEVLAAAAAAFGIDKLDSDGALSGLRQRTAFLGTLSPKSGVPSLDDRELLAALGHACAGLRSFAELRSLGLAAHLTRSFPPEVQRQLRALAPETITLPGGRAVAVNYEIAAAPSIASRLQDFFGMRETPRIGGGRVPLTLHLLAPNHRAVQVTRDLESFWRQHYPSLRRELGRRYPRHAWPEDGASASPPAPKRR
ncbi:MAG TPA: ATP-dependent helicase C-terminal domain-containing protein, partial [Polyangia bacterium]|nr:ATP-dependent helicase C-terminal domain-containing protein [Polyangia bacterium]